MIEIFLKYCVSNSFYKTETSYKEMKSYLNMINLLANKVLGQLLQQEEDILTNAKNIIITICGTPISMHVPTTGKPYVKNESPIAATVGATTTGLINLRTRIY